MNRTNGVLEYWSIGVMAAPLPLPHSITPSLHHSISF
jgi:hypothetical protein